MRGGVFRKPQKVPLSPTHARGKRGPNVAQHGPYQKTSLNLANAAPKTTLCEDEGKSKKMTCAWGGKKSMAVLFSPHRSKGTGIGKRAASCAMYARSKEKMPIKGPRRNLPEKGKEERDM